MSAALALQPVAAAAVALADLGGCIECGAPLADKHAHLVREVDYPDYVQTCFDCMGDTVSSAIRRAYRHGAP